MVSCLDLIFFLFVCLFVFSGRDFPINLAMIV